MAEQIIPSDVKTFIGIHFENGQKYVFWSPLDIASALNKLEEDKNNRALGKYEALNPRGAVVDATGKTIKREIMVFDFSEVTIFVVSEIDSSGLIVVNAVPKLGIVN